MNLVPPLPVRAGGVPSLAAVPIDGLTQLDGVYVRRWLVDSSAGDALTLLVAAVAGRRGTTVRRVRELLAEWIPQAATSVTPLSYTASPAELVLAGEGREDVPAPQAPPTDDRLSVFELLVREGQTSPADLAEFCRLDNASATEQRAGREALAEEFGQQARDLALRLLAAALQRLL